MKPKEGTILTVAKGMSEKALELSGQTDDILEFCEKIVEEGDRVLSQTPEMLPVLKQAGVVDSGGQGLMQVMKGCVDGLLGKENHFSVDTKEVPAKRSSLDKSQIDTAKIKFGYCTEFIINAEKEFTENEELEFKAYLEELGDSIVVVADEDVVKVHVHTNHQVLPLKKH